MDGAILIVDTDSHSRGLSSDLRARGCTVMEATSFDEAHEIVHSAQPDRAIVELTVGSGSALGFLATLRKVVRPPRVLVVTAFAHVGSAVEAMRLGAVGYLCKPQPATAVLGAFDGQAAEEPASLDAAIGLHIEYSLLTSGSVAEAARRLGLDRRSLRRMMARYPPR